jgi:hypothetical protein
MTPGPRAVAKTASATEVGRPGAGAGALPGPLRRPRGFPSSSPLLFFRLSVRRPGPPRAPSAPGLPGPPGLAAFPAAPAPRVPRPQARRRLRLPKPPASRRF